MLIYLGSDGVERELQNEREIVEAIRFGWLTPETQVRLSGSDGWQAISALPIYQQWLTLANTPPPETPPLPPAPPAAPSRPPWVKGLLWVGSVIVAAFVLLIIIGLLVPDDEEQPGAAPPPKPPVAQRPRPQQPPALDDAEIPEQVRAWADEFMAEMEALGDRLDEAYEAHDFFSVIEEADDFANPALLNEARAQIDGLWGVLEELQANMDAIMADAIEAGKQLELPARDRVEFLAGLAEGQEVAKGLLAELFDLQFATLGEFDAFFAFMQESLAGGRYTIEGGDIAFNNEADSDRFDLHMERIDELFYETEELMSRFDEFAGDAGWVYPEI